MAAAAITPRSFDTAFIPASLPGVSFINPPNSAIATDNSKPQTLPRAHPPRKHRATEEFKRWAELGLYRFKVFLRASVSPWWVLGLTAAEPAFPANSAAWRSATGCLAAPSPSSSPVERRRTPGARRWPAVQQF